MSWRSGADAKSEAASNLRYNRDWRLLWLGQSISVTGDYVFVTTLVVWIASDIAKGQSWGPAAVGGVLIAAAAPALIIGPFAGVFVDRWNIRKIMLTADACRALLIACLLVLTTPGIARHLEPTVQITIIYAVVAGAGCFGQFFNPARYGLMAAIVPAPDRARASGLFQASSNLAAIVGPPLAAPLLIVFGAQWALGINSLSFVISYVTIRLIRLSASRERQPKKSTSFRKELTEGLTFFARSPMLIALAVGIVIATLGSGILNALNVFFLTHNLHAAADRLGTLTAAEGAGAIVGALAAGWISARIGPPRVYLAGLFGAGLLIVVYSRLTNLYVAIVVLACAGVVAGAVSSVITPLLLAEAPNHVLGRVFAVINPLQQLAAISSMALASVLASTVLRDLSLHFADISFGTYDAILGVSGLLYLTAGVAAIRPVRHARRATGQVRASPDPLHGHHLDPNPSPTASATSEAQQRQ